MCAADVVVRGGKMMGFQMPENVIGELFAEDGQQLCLGYQSECLEIEMAFDEFDHYITCFRLSLKLSERQRQVAGLRWQLS